MTNDNRTFHAPHPPYLHPGPVGGGFSGLVAFARGGGSIQDVLAKKIRFLERKTIIKILGQRSQRKIEKVVQKNGNQINKLKK